MLSLREIVKTYQSGDTTVHALRGVSIDFRQSEFVSILGPSGCGKTTLLNVIGGRSTKEYLDADWDTYRNHSIGFVFQSYNLIMHQTVLANVELALTLSGVSREERRRRATEALDKVGLGDQLHKKPNQMSGGQMQRVAIARALVNDPEILLADEPTGALDTATSVQIMEILKEVAKTRLVIMVTHNPELAEEYSTRIIRLRDGEVTDDTDPFKTPAETAPKVADKAPETPRKAKKKDGKGKRSMSFFTALSLSLNNLMTKKTRTLLVSVAGSIGIIGIALILALSNGVNLFISNVQEETLTSYPISITAETSDYAAMLAAMVTTSGQGNENREEGKIYVDDSISNMVQAMTTTNKNNLAAFDRYLKEHYASVKDDLTAIQYSYNMDLQIYNTGTPFGTNGVLQISPSGILSDFSTEYAGLSGITAGISIFSEIMPGKPKDDGSKDLINPSVYEQYDLVDGKWPTQYDELVLVVDRNSKVTNLTLYMLGMLDPDEMTAMMVSMMAGQKYEANTSDMSFTFDDFKNLQLHLAYNSDFYERTGETYEIDGEELAIWRDLRDDANFLPDTVYKDGIPLKIVGIICPNENATATSISGSIGYTSALTDKVLAHINDSDIVKQQIAHPSHDVFTGLPFVIADANDLSDEEKVAKLEAYFSTLTTQEKAEAYLAIRTDITAKLGEYLAAVKIEMDTEAEQLQFLIDLYGFNTKNGSLAIGTTANTAVVAILKAIEPNPTIPAAMQAMGMTVDMYYAYLVAEEYAEGFGLDGNALVNDPAAPGYEKYLYYKGLIETLYDTPEKRATAFDNMTLMTIQMIYPMIETMNVYKDLLQPTAPHYQRFLAEKMLAYQGEAGMRQYVLEKLCEENGVLPTSALGAKLGEYVNGLDTAALQTEFYTRLATEYSTRLSADTAYYYEAVAALFDQYRADMVANHTAEYAALYEKHMAKSDSTYEDNLIAVGASAGHDALTAIHIYPVDFEAKERLQQLITDYNADAAEEDQISYTDIMAIMMSSVTVIIDAITYVLVAFVSISLVVSSIMIGIITYISVLERTKEIGILRAIGASKRDISRVFNAETLIIGFAAGAIGILVTLLFCIPINLIIHALSGLTNINAVLPVGAAFILVGISMALTLIAGLIPSRIASKKDPVVALRTE